MKQVNSAKLPGIENPNEEEEFDPKNPNQTLDLDFDYKSLNGKEWDRYQQKLREILLKPNGMYNEYFFELYRARPIFIERYPGLPNTPKDFVGITIDKREDPIYKTKISIPTAEIYNQQVTNEHSKSGHGRIYLLKQSPEDGISDKAKQQTLKEHNERIAERTILNYSQLK